jgi:hypothetical protein
MKPILATAAAAIAVAAGISNGGDLHLVNGR